VHTAHSVFLKTQGDGIAGSPSGNDKGSYAIAMAQAKPCEALGRGTHERSPTG